MRPLAILLLAFAGVAAAEIAVPPVARVTDLTGTLGAEQIAGLDARLQAFEARKGSQIAVLLLPTTAPETIEQYALRVAEAWKLGRSGVDDGVLLLVAKDDRALRLEVGYGLEGAVPDAIAKRIVAETITPYFQAGDIHGGIAAGVEQLIKVVDGEPLPAPEAGTAALAGEGGRGLLGLGFLVLMVSRGVGRWVGKLPAAAGAGGVFGVITFGALGVAGVAVFAAALLAFLSLALQIGGGSRGWSSRGNFGGGGFRGGGGFGGGFRGGGGGFGGGGASGRW